MLLTAEPGAGKTTFLAQLAHDHDDWPRYFIRANQIEPLWGVDAHSFLLRVGYQLAARFPELFSAEPVPISVEQQVETVDAPGEVVGARIQRLLTSPFCRNVDRVLSIRQTVGTNAGQLVGLHIEELVVGSDHLNLDELLLMALIAPAHAMARLHPGTLIVVLVGALDEAGSKQGGEPVRTWLTNCPALPDHVRFVMTSRPPDDAIRLLCQRQASRLKRLTIAPDDRRVQKDVAAYARRKAGRPGMAEQLARLGDSAEGFAERAGTRADGNLGYLDALERGLRQAFESEDDELITTLLALDGLPGELQGLYAHFLGRIRAQVEEAGLVIPVTVSGRHGPAYVEPWPALYRPLLGALAIARSSLTADQLQGFAGLGDGEPGRPHVPVALNRLAQFLDSEDGRARLYHRTLAEFLTSTRTKEHPEHSDLWIDETYFHG